MLVDEHTNGNAVHVEAVKEVLNVGLCVGIDGVGFLQFHHSLGHCHHYIRVSVSNLNQCIGESVEVVCGWYITGPQIISTIPHSKQFIHKNKGS